ncbi:MAG: sigma-70 family RNA polymerase sigma factor [Gemmataceae bacterium]|nr:sigma-70 family RNA polymerase sigma factor [Gemmataceae bacterium]
MAESAQEAGLWLSAARAGSREALGRALEACRRYLLHIAQQEVTPALQVKGSASDLVQETFLEAHRAFERFHGGSEAELRAWLRRLLLHHAAKLGRRYRTTQKRRLTREQALEAGIQFGHPMDDLRTALPTPSAQIIEQEQAEALQRALERLPDDYRRVILLRYQEGRSFEEIGRLMQRSANAARLLWLRAIERVRHSLRDHRES